MCFAAPYPLERLLRPVICDFDQIEMDLPPRPQELAQVLLRKEVHGLTAALQHIVSFQFACNGSAADPQGPILQRVDVKERVIASEKICRATFDMTASKCPVRKGRRAAISATIKLMLVPNFSCA